MLIHVKVTIYLAVYAQHTTVINIFLGSRILCVNRVKHVCNFMIIQTDFGFNSHATICITNGFNTHDVVTVHVQVSSHRNSAISLEVTTAIARYLTALQIKHWSTKIVFSIFKLLGVKQIATISGFNCISHCNHSLISFLIKIIIHYQTAKQNQQQL